jgi:hypothetical protein
MYFLNQSALWALLSLIAFLAVYFFKKKAKNVQVSTLMFFTSKGVPAEGGIELSKLQTPWILFLELLIVALLVLSLCAPVVLNKNNRASLVLILDNSYSMLAQPEHGKSALVKAKAYIKKELLSKSYYQISMVLSGLEPVVLGKYEMEPNEAAIYLDHWEAKEHASNLVKAIELAREAFGKGTRLMVLTDSKPIDLEDGYEENLLWLAFGEPLDNLAITGANRYSLGEMDRCFFEFSNFSKQEKRLEVSIKSQVVNGQKEDKLLQSLDVYLPPNGRHRTVLNLADQEAVVCAEIKSSDFGLDNRACLNPTKKAPVKVRLSLANSEQKRLLIYTVNALGIGKVIEDTRKDEDILITDTEYHKLSAWQLILPSSSSHSFVNGIIHRDGEHPLCLGLTNLRGLWAINNDFKPMGKPILTTAEHSLLSVLTEHNEKMQSKKIYLNLNTKASSISSTSFWPILFYNVLAWHQEEKAKEEAARDGESASSSKQGFSKTESSFLRLSSTDLPDKILSEGELRHFVNVGWWFVLAALALICLHAWLTGRRKGFVY